MSDKPTDSEASDDDVARTIEQRHREADDREAALNAREASRAERLEDAQGIHAHADERDQVADGRDWAADKRDMAATAKSWLHQDDEHGEALADREAAHRDRQDARADRVSSAIDRGRLTEDDDPRDGDA